MNDFKNIICIVVCLCCVVFSHAVSEEEHLPLGDIETLARIKLKIEVIRENDPEFKNNVYWKSAIDDIENFLSDGDKSLAKGEALFILARIQNQFFKINGDLKAVDKADGLYQQLFTEYSNHPKSDDALLYHGDLQRNHFKNEKKALKSFHRILTGYPSGNRVRLAKQRLGIPDSEYTGWKEVGKDGNKIAQRTKSSLVVVLDPGHGGAELGASGVDNHNEKDVVLSISKKLAILLKVEYGIEAILTRSGDSNMPLNERTEIANKSKADLFISIHANASKNSRAEGIETYYLDNTNDKSSLKLAKKENSVKGGMRTDLQFILSDLIQTAKLEDSITLAHSLQDSLISRLTQRYKGIKNLGVKKAPFYVLVGAHMPCALVEVAFIDHPKEGRRLLTEEYQSHVASSLALGVDKYFRSLGRK